MGKPTRRSMIYKYKRNLKRLKKKERNLPQWLQRSHQLFYTSLLFSTILFFAYIIVNEAIVAIKGPLWRTPMISALHFVAVATIMFPTLYAARNNIFVFLLSTLYWWGLLSSKELQVPLAVVALCIVTYATRRMKKIKVEEIRLTEMLGRLLNEQKESLTVATRTTT